MKPQIPYRITIELATPGKGKTIQLTGATEDRRAGTGDPTDVECCQMSAEILTWQANALQTAGRSQADFEQVDALVNMPTTGTVN